MSDAPMDETLYPPHWFVTPTYTRKIRIGLKPQIMIYFHGEMFGGHWPLVFWTNIHPVPRSDPVKLTLWICAFLRQRWNISGLKRTQSKLIKWQPIHILYWQVRLFWSYPSIIKQLGLWSQILPVFRCKNMGDKMTYKNKF